MGRRKHFNLQNDFYHKLNILVTFWSSALVKVVSPWSWDSCWSRGGLPQPCTLPCSEVPLCSPIPRSVWDVRNQDMCTHQNGGFSSPPPFFFLLDHEEKERTRIHLMQDFQPWLYWSLGVDNSCCCDCLMHYRMCSRVLWPLPTRCQ